MLFLNYDAEHAEFNQDSSSKWLHNWAISTMTPNPHATVMYEYIHSLQRKAPNYLAGSSLYKGAAGFILQTLTNSESDFPAEKNRDYYNKILVNFKREAYSNKHLSHLYDYYPTRVHNRSGGFYAGFLAAKNFHEKANDKLQAINHLLNIDYSNKEEVCSYFQATNILGGDCVQQLQNSL